MMLHGRFEIFSLCRLWYFTCFYALMMIGGSASVMFAAVVGELGSSADDQIVKSFTDMASR